MLLHDRLGRFEIKKIDPFTSALHLALMFLNKLVESRTQPFGSLDAAAPASASARVRNASSAVLEVEIFIQVCADVSPPANTKLNLRILNSLFFPSMCICTQVVRGIPARTTDSCNS